MKRIKNLKELPKEELTKRFREMFKFFGYSTMVISYIAKEWNVLESSIMPNIHKKHQNIIVEGMKNGVDYKKIAKKIIFLEKKLEKN